MSAYTGFAYVYDQLMENVPYEQWGHYISGVLKSKGLPKKPLVLDLACGTGTITLALAKEGFEMIGVDSSTDMLAQAQQKAYEAEEQILFLAQDMRDLDLYGTIDGAISVCDGLNYILEPDQLKAVFARVKMFLNPGGVFIFDMNTEYKFKELLGQKSFEEDSTSGATYELDNTYNPTTKINHYHVYFKDAYEEFEELHTQRAYTPEEVTAYLQGAGFTTVEIYHEYSFDAPRADSPRLSFIAM